MNDVVIDCLAVDKVPGMYYLPVFFEPLKIVPLLERVLAQSPLRHMETSRGFKLSAAMSNCGVLGWVSDRKGYRYEAIDPLTGNAWPKMPVEFSGLAIQAAKTAGYENFSPDVCLINCYKPGAGMSSHRDSDEADFEHPIVSLSLGLPARFFVQGRERKGPSVPLDLASGDVVVWGGESRLFYHGIRPLKAGDAPVFENQRFNLTFRKAG